ncbi:MAG TPA: DUF6596 domain-containing protein [Beijerinckiaceae bacterium]|jgi:RNA polymerase sigma-70 factor (ECF subfamily)
MPTAGTREAERIAREAYGRLVALAASRTRDLAAAEDAIGDALVAALAQWPRDGVPDNPEGWLLAVAKRRLADQARRAAVRAAAAASLAVTAERESEDGTVIIPDQRLALLFVCAHPAIDPAARTPLMLQAVLGLDAARIASAFLVAPAAMSQRLVRAKAKIKAAGIPFAVPDLADEPERLEAVLAAVYAAFTLGGEGGGPEGSPADLAQEAIWLARLLARLCPGEPEVLGLLALVLHCEARRPARRGPDGAYVRLTDQDPALWNGALIGEAEAALREASRHGRPGRTQIEAAIQSAHASRRQTGRTPWPAVAGLYAALRRLAPTLGAAVGEAAALLQAEGASRALACLDALDEERVATYQPYWAVRAEALRGVGLWNEARAAYERAIGLTEDEAVRRFLAAERGRSLRPEALHG